LARCALVVAVLFVLYAPAVARANGDPASDYLLVQNVFLPFNAKVDPAASKELAETIRAADEKGFKIKVAVIGSRYDLGTAFSLYNKAQKYAQFLGLELSFQFHDRLLVVMPNGYGLSVNGKPDPAGSRVVSALPPPGKDATKQVQAATKAVRKLAAASGVELPAAGSSGGASTTRDRITIAAGVVALAAVLAAIVFWRRERPSARE
jgi:pyruvate/2-oxoglutarate dehydrogenase complex dihydrolipoamide acyltransferase (E2) component